eukprot:TRINITY_DN19882_c0_g1_i1.p2 TRINITY_DN19882_c0_g1~~TRINITY_DN19882_c0_g1_i1.p2  ORF type:complete len:269 (+),score=51.89 TRINITY_DN19882_c0_g1_i1:83-889(+)
MGNPSILPDRPNGIYFRPKVIFNPPTGKWVLWFNFVTAGWDCPSNFSDCWSVYGTATADSIDGPYHIAQLPVKMGTMNQSSAHGDFALYGPGEDGKAYIMYNAYDHRGSGQGSNSVDQLSGDFTTSSLVWSGFFAGGTGGDEAQVMLERDGVWYAIVASDCCFCAGGSSAIVYRASSPMGPWVRGRDLNAAPTGARTLAAQQAFVLEVPGSGSESRFLWAGDRWQSAVDGLKSHDDQVWVPLEFDEDGWIAPLQWAPKWELPLRVQLE